MGTINKFEDLDIWQKARTLCKEIDKLCSNNLKVDFDLKRQILRSSGSIMDNIAEGFEREGNREFVNFLSIGKGSCGEVRSQLYRALDRNFINEEEFKAINNEYIILAKNISGFMNYLKNSEHKGNKFNRNKD